MPRSSRSEWKLDRFPARRPASIAATIRRCHRESHAKRCAKVSSVSLIDNIYEPLFGKEASSRTLSIIREWPSGFCSRNSLASSNPSVSQLACNSMQRISQRRLRRASKRERIYLYGEISARKIATDPKIIPGERAVLAEKYLENASARRESARARAQNVSSITSYNLVADCAHYGNLVNFHRQ